MSGTNRELIRKEKNNKEIIRVSQTGYHAF